MRRRSLIQSALALAGTLPFPGVRAWAQSVAFPGIREDTLNELAATVLPSSLGRAKTDAIAAQFTQWVREYRAGAAMSPGYGAPRLRYKGPSPAPQYQAQLAQLASGALATTDMAVRRRQLAEYLKSGPVSELTPVPEGNQIVTDLMSFYFYSPAANDLAYEAAIGKDTCRTLRNSGSAPEPLKGGRSNAAL
jgi:hypothetical protein